MTMTRTVRSRFDKEIGGIVEGCTILEKRTVMAPEPAEQRRGVWEYVVEAPPVPMKSSNPRKAASERGSGSVLDKNPEPGSFTSPTFAEQATFSSG